MEAACTAPHFFMNKFKRGDIRSDGKLFWRYETRKDKHGQPYQQWVSFDRFNELQTKHKTDRFRFDTDKSKNREQCKKSYANNKPAYYARVAKRRFSKINSIPCWLSTDQKLLISQIYAEAKKLTQETGIKYHVDHIVPLSNPTVCGLHVPWNLQIITAEANLSKSNRF